MKSVAVDGSWFLFVNIHLEYLLKCIEVLLVVEILSTLSMEFPQSWSSLFNFSNWMFIRLVENCMQKKHLLKTVCKKSTMNISGAPWKSFDPSGGGGGALGCLVCLTLIFTKNDK